MPKCLIAVVVACVATGCSAPRTEKSETSFQDRRQRVLDAVRALAVPVGTVDARPAASRKPDGEPDLLTYSADDVIRILRHSADSRAQADALKAAALLKAPALVPVLSDTIVEAERANPDVVLACRALLTSCEPPAAVDAFVKVLGRLDLKRQESTRDPNNRHGSTFFVTQRMQTVARECMGLGADALPRLREHHEAGSGYVRVLLASVLTAVSVDAPAIAEVARHVVDYPEDDGSLNDHFIMSLSATAEGRGALIEILGLRPESAGHLIAYVLGRTRDVRAVAALAAAMHRGASDRAIEALGKIGGSEAEDALIGGLTSEHEYVSAQSAAMLADLRCERALLSIRPLLLHPSSWVRREAAGAVVRLGDAAGEEVRALLEGRCPRFASGLARLDANTRVPDAHFDRIKLSPVFRERYAGLSIPCASVTADEVVLKGPGALAGVYVYVTPETARIVEACDGTRTVGDLVAALGRPPSCRDQFARWLVEALLVMQAHVDLEWLPHDAAARRGDAIDVGTDRPVPLVTRAYVCIKLE